ncbi:serine acetyltransferase [Hanstruepera ponticola]|uniref:serine acetyltransferase n=1 Tax=Hanstruepera ponticola TaxID=2042995 RepID=UPI0019699EC7|nr:hypothetical protein [Hanstruepera ponticola]
MSLKLRHILKKLLLKLLFQKYVLSNDVVKADMKQTLAARGSKMVAEIPKKQFDHLMLYYPEFAFLFFWRIDKNNYRWRRLFVKEFHCKIFKSTKIAGGLMCYHPFATVINAKSIGENFQFRNGLTIGNKNNDNSLLPEIGNNVTVGAQVVIIGDIVIGDNVSIGAGSVVVKDVPSNCVIAGNPAQIIRTLPNE